MASNDFKQRVVFELVDKASAKAGKIASSFDKIKQAVAGLAVFAVATRAIRAFIGVLNEAAAAAATQEKAVTKLNIALSRTGSVEKYSKALQAQAAELQQLGLAGDEAIIATQSLLIEMGVAPSRMKEATEATLNLSAAFGITLENAARNIGRTIGGLAGELGELIPELKAMQAEGRLAGEGIEFLNAKFAGAAAGQVDLYANAIGRLNSALSDTQEAIGEGQISQSVVGSINAFSGAVKNAGQALRDSGFSQYLEETKTGWIDLGTAITRTTVFILQQTGHLTSQEEIVRLSVVALAELNKTKRESFLVNQKLAEGERVLKEIWRGSLIALKARTEAQLDAITAEEAFLDSVKALGVVLEDDLNAAMEENIRLLIEADERYRSGLIGRQDFENITKAVAESERVLRGEFEGTNTALHELDVTFGEASDNIDAYTRSTEAATGATQRFTVAATNASAPIGGGISLAGNGISGLDQRKTILGGTRTQVRGGSRLERA